MVVIEIRRNISQCREHSIWCCRVVSFEIRLCTQPKGLSSLTSIGLFSDSPLSAILQIRLKSGAATSIFFVALYAISRFVIGVISPYVIFSISLTRRIEKHYFLIYLRKSRNSAIKIKNRVPWFWHTNASLLISQGVDVRTVASLLGHAQASTTLDIYAHAFDKNKRKAQ